MRRSTRQQKKQRNGTVAQLRGLETLPSRIVLSGMVNLAPGRAVAIPEADHLPAETGFANHDIRNLQDMDLESLTRDLVPADECGNDTAFHIREANRRESETPVPVAQPRAHMTETDIPVEMRSHDEVFGGRVFWIRGSRPLDNISQQVSGPGADSHLKAILAPTPILPQSPIEQIAGPPESNVDSILGDLPSLSDLKTCQQDKGATLGSAPISEIIIEDDDEEEEQTPEPKTPPKEDPPPEDNWDHVDPPWWSPSWLDPVFEFWNKGMSLTTNETISVSKHLD